MIVGWDLCGGASFQKAGLTATVRKIRRSSPKAVCGQSQYSRLHDHIDGKHCAVSRGSQLSRSKRYSQVVKLYAARSGFTSLAPHDLRRSCAKLCHSAGGELEQIQFLLGHVSVQTTERYLGCKQRIDGAVNDRIGIEP